MYLINFKYVIKQLKKKEKVFFYKCFLIYLDLKQSFKHNLILNEYHQTIINMKNYFKQKFYSF